MAESYVERVAATLGGEVVNENTVICPSPGYDHSDRSCTLRVWSEGSEPYVYSCYGSRAAAAAVIRERLGLPDRPVGERSEFVLDSIYRTWDEARPLTDYCDVTKYLRGRAITIRPDDIRFHPKCFHSREYRRYPAMVAARRDVRGRLVAIHRTYLNGEGGKAEYVEPRKELGPCKGTAIRLGPVANGHVILGEGIETVLSVMQMLGVTNGWAAGSAGALESVLLPPEVRRVTIPVDDDPAGERSSRIAGRIFSAEGREVKLARLPNRQGKGRDWNDVLREGW